MSAIRLLQILALTAGAAAFAPYAGPDLESFDFVYQVPDGPALRIAGQKPRGRVQPGSGAGYYVVPAGEISLIGPAPTPHNSFSNPIDGFFAPGGTEVWQAEAAFEWLLGAAFGP